LTLTKAYRELRSVDVPMQSDIDSQLIYQTVLKTQPRNILEIGFKDGYSLGLIIEAISGPASVTTVDITHESIPQFVNLYKEELEQIDLRMVTKDSREMVDHPYDFIHVDGNHGYEFVASDLRYALRNLIKSGTLMVDDCHLPDVKRAVDEVLVSSDLKLVGQGFTQTVWRR